MLPNPSSKVLVLGTITLMVLLQMFIFISNLDYETSSREETTLSKLGQHYPFLENSTTINYISSEIQVMFFLRGVPPGRGRSALAQAIVDTFSQNSVFCCSSQTTSVDVSDQNCLQEVEINCKKHIRVIVVDHADNPSKDLKKYFSMAHQYNYTTVVVQPNTTVREDGGNVLQVRESNEVLQTPKMLYPLFYGWFLGYNISLDVQRHRKTLYDECLQQSKFVEIFNKFALPGSPHNSSGGLDFGRYFSLTGLLTGPTLLHCTSFFSNYGNRTGSKQYATSSAVKQNTGGAYNLSIIGFLITPQTFGARLRLTKDELALWGVDNSKEADKTHTESNVGSRSWVKTNKVITARTSDTLNVDKPVSCPKGWRPQEFSPTCGPGSRAHLTLGLGVNISAVQTGIDLNLIIQQELLARDKPKDIPTLQLAGGIARCYGEGNWAIYLEKPLKVGALFSGWN
ncbi:2',3'-cyclic-nucleotide 3'-phosphodiesterase-like isoform X1 [Asterias rubens]|uniref:2',3'-cyclic-nucleotide 3'-phosphodiesterase-like isoform X1 n=1 Tax=Asterias rubens TaxID=7604 RepID=UPI0014555F04|nr:2',3'-cyclic-nucleotide 3'-phosphodiesterase-like isoform X1 [Asterias rubens]